MPKRPLIVMALAAAAACPLAAAENALTSAESALTAGDIPLTFADVTRTLTMGAATSTIALRSLAAEASLPSLSVAERDLLRAAMADPLTLFELARVPPELIARLTLHELGSIRGAHVADVPSQNAFAAIALDGDGVAIDADSLRPLHQRASVRNEPSAAQIEDMNAMLSERYG